MRHGSSKFAVAACAGAALVVASCTPAENARASDAARAVDGVPELTASGPLIIGDSDGPDDDFVLPLAVGRDGSGTIYVLDGSEVELRKFGTDGSFEGLVARRGRGPGELQSPSAVLIDSAYVHVWDGRLGRYSRLSDDGRLLFDVTFGWPAGRGHSTSAVDVVSDSMVVLAVRSEILPATPHGRPLLRTAYVRTDARAGSRDTLYAYEAVSTSLVLHQGRARMIIPGPRPGPIVFFDGSDTTVVRIDSAPPSGSEEAEFTIRRIDAAGRVVRETRFRTSAQAVADEVRDSLRDIVWNSLGAMGTGSRQDEELAGLVDTLWPDYWPAATAAALSRGGDGHIWIELSGPREQAGRIWLVMDRDFEPVGRVRIPLELDYVAPFGREIWGTARVEDGVAVIAGFSLDSPGS